MSILPPLPSWDAAHPVLIHVPLGSLPLALVFVLLSMVMRGQWSKMFAASALILMVIGTLGAFIAVMSGEATAELAEGTGPMAVLSDPVIEDHEELAELARTVFAILTAVYAIIFVVLGRLSNRGKSGPAVWIQSAFLLLYGSALLLLVNAAHLGGRLVHEFGIHAPIARYTGPDDLPPVPARLDREDEDD
ncbi:MAG: hypothetical protein Kow0022_17480 [Phycisphaerales bacterium]